MGLCSWCKVVDSHLLISRALLFTHVGPSGRLFPQRLSDGTRVPRLLCSVVEPSKRPIVSLRVTHVVSIQHKAASATNTHLRNSGCGDLIACCVLSSSSSHTAPLLLQHSNLLFVRVS